MKIGVNGGSNTRTVDAKPSVETTKLTQPRVLCAWSCVLAVLFTALGSEEEGALTVALNFVGWFVQIGCGLLVVALVTRWLQDRGLARFPFLLQLMCSGFVGAACFTPLALALEYVLLIAGIVGDADVYVDLRTGLAYALGQEFLALAPSFIASWLLINLSYLGVGPRLQPAIEPKAPPRKPVAEGLLSRLKPALGYEIILLKADLNYVHVFTTLGQTMVLYSLTRAAEELADQGLLVHRSYWVANNAVKQVRRSGGQLVLTLQNGMNVPVSRRRQAAVLAKFGADFRAADFFAKEQPG